MSTSARDLERLANPEYKWGFVTDVEQETIPPGLSEDVIRLISHKKEEPEWMLEWRLRAYRRWLEMEEPHWPHVRYDPIVVMPSLGLFPFLAQWERNRNRNSHFGWVTRFDAQDPGFMGVSAGT